MLGGGVICMWSFCGDLAGLERDNVNDAGLSLAVLLTANSSVGCYREETRMRDFVS